MAEQTWLKDSNGNKCSVEFFGSQEAAQKALDGLKDCENCTNCSDCSRCSHCSRCSRCSHCSDCSRCSGCSDCLDCSGLIENKPTLVGAPPIPIIKDIHKKVYAAVTSTPDALDMSDWHTCKTTHCRGGWVTTLAGEEGKALENFHGTLLAAQLIYDASDTSRKFNPCRFFDTNSEALENMKRLAEAS